MAYLSFEDVTQAPPGKPEKVGSDSGYLSFEDVVGPREGQAEQGYGARAVGWLKETFLRDEAPEEFIDAMAGAEPIKSGFLATQGKQFKKAIKGQMSATEHVENLKKAGRDVVVAADMLAGFPAFLAGWMTKSTLAGGMAVTGETKPFTEARKIVEGTIAESPTLQAASHPIARILGVDVKNSGLGELFGKVDEVTNKWAAEGKDEEAQSLRSHLVETLMALIPTAVKHGTAGVKAALKKKAPIGEPEVTPEEPSPEMPPEEPSAAKTPFETYATPGAAVKAAKAAAKEAKKKAEEAAVQTGPASYTHTDGTVHEVEITGAPKKVSGMSMTPVRVGDVDTWVPTKQVELKKPVEPGFETEAQSAERMAQMEAERIPSERVAEATAAPLEEQIRMREQRQAEEDQAWVQHGEQMKVEAEQAARSAEEQKAFEAEQARQDQMEAEYGEPPMRAKQAGWQKQKGEVDPELLAKIALTGGVAAYLALHPEDTDKVGLLGAGVLATKGKIDFKSLNEPALISHVREGHPEAFTELYERTAPQARRFISSFEKQGIDVEDVLQRTYEKLATVLQRSPEEVGGFAGKSAIQTFINTMARNRAKNMLEYEGHRPTESIDIVSPEGTTLGETLGHEITPEVTLQRQQLSEHLQAALDKIDPNFRQSFELREMEGKSYEEIAEIRGIPVGTVRSQISRAKDQLKKNLRDYVNPESGRITPDMQAALIASGLGGLVGAYMNREDSPAKGALIGVAGVAAAIAGVSKMGPALMRGTTKLAEIYPPFRRSLRDMEVRSMQEVEKASAKIHDFIEATKKLPPALATQLKRAHLYGDAEALKEVLNKDPALAKGYQKVRAFLDETQKTLQQMGRFSKGLTDYLPLMVKDYTGLVEALGREDKIDLQKLMDKAEKKSQELRGKPLSDVERSIVVAKWISKAPSTQGLPGFAKKRVIRMQDKLMPFYHTLQDSLVHYAHASVDDIATATFFGTDLKVALKEGKTYTDINKSIQAMVDRGLREGKLTKESAAEMQQILRARFVEGRLAPGKLLQDFRNVAGLLTLGQIGSGLVQTSESIFSVYHHSFVPTIQAVGLLARGKSIAPKEFGLAEHVIEENLGRTATGKALGVVLKANLLKTMDQLGMRQNLTASFVKNKMLVRSPRGIEELKSKWGADYAEDFPQLVKELQSATLDKRTPLVDSLLFQELSDIRPASRIENPILFNKHPNLRFMWQLKQYMVTMADVLYRDSYQKLKSPDPIVVATGVKNLALYATTLALASIPADAIKNWLFGRGLQLDKIDYVDNIARNFGISRYDISKVEQSQKPFVTAYETLAGTVTPPIASVTKSLAEGVAAPEKLVAMVPMAGRIVYNRELGGNIAHQRAVDKAELAALRAKILSKNPQLQKQLELVQEMAKTSNPAIGGARERLHNMPAYQALQEQLKRQKQQQAKGVR